MDLPVSFDRAFEIVIGAEGGYSNDPKDRGGETKYGISKRAYPYLDIPSLTLDNAMQKIVELRYGCTKTRGWGNF